jgi:hypothetical protein
MTRIGCPVRSRSRTPNILMPSDEPTRPTTTTVVASVSRVCGCAPTARARATAWGRVIPSSRPVNTTGWPRRLRGARPGVTSTRRSEDSASSASSACQ